MLENSDSNQLLAATARWTAAVRANESTRHERLFDDPWAAALAGAEGMAWIEQRSASSVIPIVIRTRYFDDFLTRITCQGIRQVVLMAAGLDTRAYRLTWPENTRLFELDQPVVLQYKQRVLQATGAQPACQRRTVEADLTAPWQELLVAAGYEARVASVWLLEGFLFYLPFETLRSLLGQVASQAAPGSWMGFDIINREVLTSPLTRSWVEMQADSGAPWIGALDDPQTFLAGLGWRASLTQGGQPDAHYGRWLLPVIPADMPGVPHSWLVTAVKQEPAAT